MSEGAARQLALFFDATPVPVWMDYFNQRAAVEAVVAYIGTLPSSRTEEKHTSVAYMGGLTHFLDGIERTFDRGFVNRILLPAVEVIAVA